MEQIKEEYLAAIPDQNELQAKDSMEEMLMIDYNTRGYIVNRFEGKPDLVDRAYHTVASTCDMSDDTT